MNTVENARRPYLRKDVREDTPAPTLERSDPRDDSLARARARAAELLGEGVELDDGTDAFLAPPAPEGWTYEWKRQLVLGKDDPTYQNRLMKVGWEPVMATRHPDMMPPGHTGAIIRDGLILCECPTVVVEAHKSRDNRIAREQVNIRAGNVDATGQEALQRNHIKKQYAPREVPVQ